MLIEFIVFSCIGTNFLTAGNLFEIPRINVELGLIALAMTPVIVTGGIDLSVGSLLALCAVVFGKVWHDCGYSIALGASAAITVGLLAGGLNALLITKLRIPPLIVTLGTYSLFRGVAEGITKGSEIYTNFPNHFIALGQGYLFGWLPAQLPIFIVAAIFFDLLLHRSTVGRALSAIGFSPEGARHAGIPVERRVALAYVLTGLCSAIAAIIFVARVAQAKADAGTGYELSAITAVVLGGTSIFGGVGSILGTLLGLFAIAILQNGCRLADLPTELALILTGVLLILSIAAQWRPAKKTVPATPDNSTEEFSMKNAQLAILCVVILIAAGIITAGNYMLVNSMRSSGGGTVMMPGATAVPGQPAAKHLTIAMMPKSKGNAYFIACHKGAEDAAKELNVDLLWDGPTDNDPAKQNEIVETWITRGVDAIAVSVDNRDGLSTVLRKAIDHGIKVVTFDADANANARDFFVNQATPQGIGETLMDDAAKSMGGKGSFAIITATLTAANQNEWIKYIKQHLAEKYPDINLITIEPCDDNPTTALEKAKTLLNAYPNMKCIVAISTQAVPASAEAVKQSGRKDVHVVGLGLPNENKQYVHQGITTAVVLWNTMDLGYLTVYAADALKLGTLKAGDTSLTAGRIGAVDVKGDNVMLGTPYTFNDSNIDKFDF